MSKWMAAVKQVYEQQLKAHYLAQYKAYCQEQEGGDRYDLGKSNRVLEEIATLPQAVQTLQQEALDQGDSYYANIYKLSVEQQITYAVRITTDGDDGVLIIFDQQGQVLASAQTYLEVVVWAEDQTDEKAIRAEQPIQAEESIRAEESVQAKKAIDLLANPLSGFEAAKSQTLWGKPLSELESSV